ncbi:conserved hypothetical protein, partial [Listeria monocytogenes FSL F2-208]
YKKTIHSRLQPQPNHILESTTILKSTQHLPRTHGNCRYMRYLQLVILKQIPNNIMPPNSKQFPQ